MDIVYGLGLGVVMYMRGFGDMDMHTHTGIVFIYHGQIFLWMEKLNFLLACRQIFLLYIGLYWVTMGLGISHQRRPPGFGCLGSGGATGWYQSSQGSGSLGR